MSHVTYYILMVQVDIFVPDIYRTQVIIQYAMYNLALEYNTINIYDVTVMDMWTCLKFNYDKIEGYIYLVWSKKRNFL